MVTCSRHSHTPSLVYDEFCCCCCSSKQIALWTECCQSTLGNVNGQKHQQGLWICALVSRYLSLAVYGVVWEPTPLFQEYDAIRPWYRDGQKADCENVRGRMLITIVELTVMRIVKSSFIFLCCEACTIEYEFQLSYYLMTWWTGVVDKKTWVLHYSIWNCSSYPVDLCYVCLLQIVRSTPVNHGTSGPVKTTYIKTLSSNHLVSSICCCTMYWVCVTGSQYPWVVPPMVSKLPWQPLLTDLLTLNLQGFSVYIIFWGHVGKMCYK